MPNTKSQPPPDAESPLLRPLLELAEARNEAVEKVCAGHSVVERVVTGASWLSEWLKANSGKGQLIKSETLVPQGVAERILSEVRESSARTWLVERDGVYGGHEVERLEKALAGLLTSFRDGIPVNQSDAQAIQSAAKGLHVVFCIAASVDETEHDRQQDDATNYALVSELWPQRSEFTRADQVTRYLNKLPNTPAPKGIRNRKEGQRRYVHVADWHRHFQDRDRAASESLDQETVTKSLDGVVERYEKERTRKQGK